MSGDLTFKAAQLRLETRYEPRIRAEESFERMGIIALINNWKPIMGADLADGRADTEFGFGPMASSYRRTNTR
jgi:hypothetical protein